MRQLRLGMAVSGTLLAVQAVPASPTPSEGLRICAAISEPAQRLACYDQLAGRPAGPPAPLLHSAPEHTPVPAASPGAQPSFGLYTAEHPVAPLSPTLTARVLGIGAAASGRPTLALEGGQLWELERADPLLAQGDVVTIRRGALGSFTLTSAQGRSYKARRLR